MKPLEPVLVTHQGWFVGDIERPTEQVLRTVSIIA